MENGISIWEIIMVVCFGASWPFAILKTIRVKNPAGKSYLFMGLIIIGYLAGCIHKIIYDLDAAIWLYVLNIVLVATDFVLCLYYQYKLNKKAQQQAAADAAPGNK
ncbi:MAG: hypothetical protein J5858_07020 [Lentisphaeria bacterium]|nr:hypothetical protein [Lentisphaeria bacterium]